MHEQGQRCYSSTCMSDDEVAGRILLALHRQSKALCRAKAKLRFLGNDLAVAATRVQKALDSEMEGAAQPDHIPLFDEVVEAWDAVVTLQGEVTRLREEANSVQ